MHQVKYKAVSNSQTFMPADKIYGSSRRHFISFATVIHHGGTVVITFNEQSDQRCDPSKQWNEGQEKKQ